MIRLDKFYGLISRDAHVTLANPHLDAVYFEGSLKNVPDEFDECEVTDFAVSDEGDFLFKLSVKAKQKTADDRLWHEGSIGWNKSRFHYWYKQYETGSQFGIEGGRISKLMLKRDDKIVANYDRGWDVEPVDEDTKAAVEILLDRENW